MMFAFCGVKYGGIIQSNFVCCQSLASKYSTSSRQMVDKLLPDFKRGYTNNDNGKFSGSPKEGVTPKKLKMSTKSFS